jgi:glyoxylase-like metal-dependent hydrolase (beta-lactamase superfamily II)
LNLAEDMPCDGQQFDYLFSDNELVELGHLKIQVIHTPGHTPSCVSYLIEESIFVGDAIFMPDFGTPRTDFPKGNAKVLYHSIQKILSLPNNTRVFVGHDYKSESRSQYAWETTVIEEKLNNIHIKNGITQEEFRLFREARDAGLPAPALLAPSIEFNIQAGKIAHLDEVGT